MKLLKWPFLILNWIIAIALLLSYVSTYFSPENGYFMPILGLFMPYLLIVNVLAVLAWTFAGKRYFWISAATLVIGVPWILNLVQFSYEPTQQSANQVQIVSFNIHHFYDIQKLRKKGELDPQLDAWTTFARQLNGIDILCVQENNKQDIHTLPETADLKYSYHCKTRGTAIYTSLPIIHSGCIDFQNTVNSALYADLRFPQGDTVRIFNIHLQSNQISHLTDEMLKEKNLGGEENWKRTRTALGRYIRTAGFRVQQIKKVMEAVRKSPHPVILCGDFNEGPQSYVYRIVEDELIDAFVKKGQGFSSTYAGSLPFLRIDHIFTSEEFEVRDYAVGSMKLSDHYPVGASVLVDADADAD